MPGITPERSETATCHTWEPKGETRGRRLAARPTAGLISLSRRAAMLLLDEECSQRGAHEVMEAPRLPPKAAFKRTAHEGDTADDLTPVDHACAPSFAFVRLRLRGGDRGPTPSDGARMKNPHALKRSHNGVELVLCHPQV